MKLTDTVKKDVLNSMVHSLKFLVTSVYVLGDNIKKTFWMIHV